MGRGAVAKRLRGVAGMRPGWVAKPPTKAPRSAREQQIAASLHAQGWEDADESAERFERILANADRGAPSVTTEELRDIHQAKLRAEQAG